MKVGIIVYHSNLQEYISKEILEKCLNSILNQTFYMFDIIELCYDYEDNGSILDERFNKFKQIYQHKFLKNPNNALNYLLNKCFNELNYNIIFNINLDDYYDINRFAIQLQKIIYEQYDIVFSNYYQIKNNLINYVKPSFKDNHEDRTDEQTYYKIKIQQNKLKFNLSSMAITKNAWNKIKEIKYIPTMESLLLLKECYKHKLEIHNCIEPLMYHRIHTKQYSNKYKRMI